MADDVGTLRTVECHKCGRTRPAMRCRCDSGWLCFDCALAGVHKADCPADLAAIAAHRDGRDRYPPG